MMTWAYFIKFMFLIHLHLILHHKIIYGIKDELCSGDASDPEVEVAVGGGTDGVAILSDEECSVVDLVADLEAYTLS